MVRFLFLKPVYKRIIHYAVKKEFNFNRYSKEVAKARRRQPTFPSQPFEFFLFIFPFLFYFFFLEEGQCIYLQNVQVKVTSTVHKPGTASLPIGLPGTHVLLIPSRKRKNITKVPRDKKKDKIQSSPQPGPALNSKDRKLT